MNGCAVLRWTGLCLGGLLLVTLPARADRQVEMNVDIAKKALAAMDTGKTTLAKAIEVAEAHAKGKAVYAHAQFDAKGEFSIEVCCLVGDQLKEVLVDKAGKVASMRDEPNAEKPAGKGKDEPKKPDNPPKSPG